MKKCEKPCVHERERTVSCGGCVGGENGEIKLEWFVSKANWDWVKTKKCVIVDGNRALLLV